MSGRSLGKAIRRLYLVILFAVLLKVTTLWRHRHSGPAPGSERPSDQGFTDQYNENRRDVETDNVSTTSGDGRDSLELTSVEAVKKLGDFALLGAIPAGFLFVLGELYYIAVDIMEGFTSFRFPVDQSLYRDFLVALCLAGFLVGSLVGFFKNRDRFSVLAQYAMLFLIGFVAAAGLASVQYVAYQSSPSNFSVSGDVLETVGTEYTSERRKELNSSIAYNIRFAAVANQVAKGLSSMGNISYLEPKQHWLDNDCRHFDVAGLVDYFCVRRLRMNLIHGAYYYDYWPVLKSPGLQEGEEYMLDASLLTGEYRCDAVMESAGGMSLLSSSEVRAADLMPCFAAAEMAFRARADAARLELNRLSGVVIVPFWYFLAEAQMSLVGSDFQLVKPVSPGGVFAGVAFAIFRFLYFAVFVTTLIGTSRSK